MRMLKQPFTGVGFSGVPVEARAYSIFLLTHFEVFYIEIFKDIKGNVQGGSSVCLCGGHVVIF